jgi:hypothetical protein
METHRMTSSITPFMDQDFLLTTGVARQLYHDVAADLPVTKRSAIFPNSGWPATTTNGA